MEKESLDSKKKHYEPPKLSVVSLDAECLFMASSQSDIDANSVIVQNYEDGFSGSESDEYTINFN